MRKHSSTAEPKAKIYFARTYRHLQIHTVGTIVFLLAFLLPMTILLLLFYDELTWFACQAAIYLLHLMEVPWTTVGTSSFLPFFGPVYYVSAPTVFPGPLPPLVNLAIVLCLVWLLSTGPRKGRPIAIYLSITLLIHAMACLFFLLGGDLFPYTLADYSDLYVKQQVGIWLAFLVLMGLIMGLLGRGGILRRILTVLLLMAYSLLFGTVRYALFLGILFRFSVLYMPVMFFALGPLFDFLYFVAIYAISVNGMIRIYDSKRKGEWLWA